MISDLEDELLTSQITETRLVIAVDYGTTFTGKF